jgi:ubiquinone/menaquinone biosynthesis C-methylase UbiE
MANLLEIDEEKYWTNLEKLYVHDVYEKISHQYDQFFDLNKKVRHQLEQDEEKLNADDISIEAKKNFQIKRQIQSASSPLKQKQVNGEKKVKKSSQKNYRAWPRVKKFLMQLDAYSIVADVGCGEGKYLNLNSKTFSIGCDRSSSLCQLSSSKSCSSHGLSNGKNQVLVCDNLSLPFR